LGFRILGLVEGLGLRIRVEGFGVVCMCVCVCHVTPLTHHNTLLPPLQHIHTGGRAFFRCGPNRRGVDATPTHAADGSALFARCRTVSPFARCLSLRYTFAVYHRDTQLLSIYQRDTQLLSIPLSRPPPSLCPCLRIDPSSSLFRCACACASVCVRVCVCVQVCVCVCVCVCVGV
jgi:hypothetical protein